MITLINFVSAFTSKNLMYTTRQPGDSALGLASYELPADSNSSPEDRNQQDETVSVSGLVHIKINLPLSPWQFVLLSYRATPPLLTQANDLNLLVQVLAV